MNESRELQDLLLEKGILSLQTLKKYLAEDPTLPLAEKLITAGVLSLEELEKLKNEIEPQPLALASGAILGTYEIIEKLGEGSMGEVFKVLHQTLGKEFALKLIHEKHSSKAQRQRFNREAKTTAKLKHPNIIHVIDSGKTEDYRYFVMEYVKGHTLLEKIETGFSSLKEGIDLLMKSLIALDYAHKKKILHRDLKPENIFISLDGEPKIADFGVAKDFSANQDSFQLTYSGELLGTPHYLPPEIITGQTTEFSAATDVYSMGVCLYQILTGRCPYEADSVLALIYKMSQEEIEPPSKLNTLVVRDLEAISLKAIHKNPAERYQSASAFAKDLSRFIRGYPIHAKTTHWLGKLIKWGNRNRKILLLTTIIFCSFFSFFLYLQLQKYWAQQKQFTAVYKQAEEEKAQGEKKALPLQTKIKHLLNALNHLNTALYLNPKHPKAKKDKQAITLQLMQHAFETKEYQLAYYAVFELRSSISSENYLSMIQKIKKEENRLVKEHLLQFDYWIQKLKTGDLLIDDKLDALYEIKEMKEKEIFEKLLQLLQEGNQYFQQPIASRQVKKNEFYEFIVEVLGHLKNPQAAEPLMLALKKMQQEMSSIDEISRPRDQTAYMFRLAQALANLRNPKHAEVILEACEEMGKDSYFSKKTRPVYLRLIKRASLSPIPK